MTTVALRRLIDEQNKLWTRMQEIRQASVDENRDWTAEERTNWDAADARITEVSADIERHERMAHLESVDYGQVLQGSGTDDPADSRGEGGDTAEVRERKFAEAFGKWLRGGMDNCTRDERVLMGHAAAEVRAQSIATPSAGGYLVPAGFRQTMTETLKAFGGLINYANVIQTATGNTLSWPTNNDTSNVGAILAENTQITEQALTFGTKSVGAYTYTSKLVLVSVQLMQDSVFDLDTFLPRKLGERIGRAVANDLINGTGTGQPVGALPTSTQGVTTANAGFVANTSSAGYNALIDLEHSIDPAYRQLGRCRFLFNDATLKLLRKFTDSQLRPLWLPVPVPGMPSTVNGNPYTIDQAMPDVGVGNKSILFGDFQAGYLVRQALDVQAIRLAERYADYLQVGFFGFMRLDATPDDTSAYKHLVTS